jgi:PhnB protein
MTRLHSYFNFAGNAEEAFGFYRSVFGGEFSSVVRFKDLPIEGVSIPEADQELLEGTTARLPRCWSWTA